MKSHLLALPLALLLVQCHKNSPNPAKPEDQLPAATQTGAGTFGCLVNGQPWLPSGNSGIPNSVALYDQSINSPTGAQVNIKAYRLADTDTYMTLYARKIDAQKRTFTMNLPAFGQPVTESFGCYDGNSASFCGNSLTYLAGQIEMV
jgi:hypothetical protein